VTRVKQNAGMGNILDGSGFIPQKEAVTSSFPMPVFRFFRGSLWF
jgi:ABC-type Mn2+/Zn2+ transport system ATPase subunit